MTGTLIVDSSFLKWLERCQTIFVEGGGDPAQGPWRALDQLAASGFKIVIPNEVLRESIGFRYSTTGVGMGTRQNEDGEWIPLLKNGTLQNARSPIGNWLLAHKKAGHVKMHSSLGRFMANRQADGNEAQIELVPTWLAPDESELQERPPAGAQRGDDEIRTIAKAMEALDEPVLVLAHDKQLSKSIMAYPKAVSGNMFHFLDLAKRVGIDTDMMQPAFMAAIRDDWFREYLQERYQKNASVIDKEGFTRDMNADLAMTYELGASDERRQEDAKFAHMLEDAHPPGKDMTPLDEDWRTSVRKETGKDTGPAK